MLHWNSCNTRQLAGALKTNNMARIFNIYFRHEGNSYSALVTIGGKKDHENVSVTTQGGQIQITLSNGRLMLPISEVLHKATASHRKGEDAGAMQITDTISLQVLNTSL